MNKPPMDQNRISYEGVKRRDEILRLAQGAARTRKHRRNVIRTMSANLAFVVIASITAMVATQVPMGERRESGGSSPLAVSKPPAPVPTAVPAEAESVKIVYIQTDMSLVDRLSIRPEPPRWEVISDEQLLEQLAQSGEPAGLVTLNGQTHLLFRNSRGQMQ